MAAASADGGNAAAAATTTATGGSDQKADGTKAKASKRKKEKEEELVRVTTAAEMSRLLEEGKALFELDARGDSQEALEGREDEHPVLEALRKRAKAGTKPGAHGDGMKVRTLKLRFGRGRSYSYTCSSYVMIQRTKLL